MSYCVRCGNRLSQLGYDGKRICYPCECEQYDLGTYETYECKHDLRVLSSGFQFNTYCCKKCGDIVRLEWRSA